MNITLLSNSNKDLFLKTTNQFSYGYLNKNLKYSLASGILQGTTTTKYIMPQWDSFQKCKYVSMKATINIIHYINIARKNTIIAVIVNKIFDKNKNRAILLRLNRKF